MMGSGLLILILLALYIGCKQKYAVYNVSVVNPHRKDVGDVPLPNGSICPGSVCGKGSASTTTTGIDTRFKAI